MNQSREKIIQVFLAASLLSGCATTEDFARVTYVAKPHGIRISTGSNTINLDVVDNRGVERDKIGTKVDTVGNEAAALRSTVPVRDIVKKAIADELKARGLTIGGGSPTIDVSITAMHTIFVPGWPSGSARGIVAFTVNVIGEDGTIHFKERYAGIYKETDVIARSGENAAKAVEGALAKSMEALFDDRKFTAALTRA